MRWYVLLLFMLNDLPLILDHDADSLPATKEVILSTGPINTSHSPMSPGIGDLEDLTAVEIKPLGDAFPLSEKVTQTTSSVAGL